MNKRETIMVCGYLNESNDHFDVEDIFQNNNAFCHRAKEVKAFLKKGM